MSQATYQARAYPSLCSMNQLGVFLCTWVDRGTVRVKCRAKNTTQCPQPGLEPGMLDPEMGVESFNLTQEHNLTICNQTSHFWSLAD